MARKPDGLIHQLTDAMNRQDLPAIRAAEEVANQKRVRWGRIEFDVVEGRVSSIVAINKRPGDTTYWEA